MPLECIIFAQIQFVTPNTTRLTSAHFQSDISTSNHNGSKNRRSAQIESENSPADHIGSENRTSAQTRSDFLTPGRLGLQNLAFVQFGSKNSTSDQIGLLVTTSAQSAEMAIFGGVQNGPKLSVSVYSGSRKSPNCPVWTTLVQQSPQKSVDCLFRSIRDQRGLFQPILLQLREFEGREGGGGIRLFVVQNAEGLAQAVREREPAMPEAGSEGPA